MGRPLGDGIAKCEAALTRIAEGIFNIPKHRGKKITCAMVSKEAGLDPGFIKPSREQHRHLIASINELNGIDSENDSDASQSASGTRRPKDKKIIDDLKNKLSASLSREVLLLETIRELQEELASKQITNVTSIN